MSEVAVREETLRKIDLEPGDILHIVLGIADLHDGQGPWIPSQDEINEAKEAWERLIPEGVRLLVTHCGVEATRVRQAGKL